MKLLLKMGDYKILYSMHISDSHQNNIHFNILLKQVHKSNSISLKATLAS